MALRCISVEMTSVVISFYDLLSELLGLVVICPGIPSVCKQVVSVETTRDIPWVTFTCTLGFHVFGEFQAIMCNNKVA